MRSVGPRPLQKRRGRTQTRLGTPGVWYVYYLVCRGGSIYTGMTNNLARRLQAHNSGRGARYTASRRPVRLAGVEEHASRRLAASREARVKLLPRRDKIRIVREALEAGSSGLDSGLGWGEIPLCGVPGKGPPRSGFAGRPQGGLSDPRNK